MEKLQSITIENNEAYLRQISKKVTINDPELHNNIVVLQDYCMQNDVMAMAAVQLGIPKRIIYVKNTNLDILNKRLTDEGKEETKDYNEAKILINPEIISSEGLTTFWEACASCSWYEENVKKWYNLNPFDNNDISSYTVNSFGESVRQRREELDISVRKMAKRLGMSAMYLSDIERGKRPAPSGNISGKDYMSILENGLK